MVGKRWSNNPAKTKSTKYPQNLINYSARQQSNRSVSDSLMWQKLAGCRYITGGINLDTSETSNWMHRSRYLNYKSKKDFVKRWLKYRSPKQVESQMTMWYGSSRLRGLRNIQSDALPPQGKGPQDSGVCVFVEHALKTLVVNCTVITLPKRKINKGGPHI